MVFIPIGMLVLMTVVIPIITGMIGELIPNPRAEAMVSAHGAVLMILNVILSLVLLSKLGKIKMNDLGFEYAKAFSKVLIDMFSGFVGITIVAFTIKTLGGVTMTYSFKPENISAILIALVLFSFQGRYEEIVYRGYLLPHFAKNGE